MTLAAVVEAVGAELAAAGKRPVLVGVAGSVAVGKTTFAEQLRHALAPVNVAVLATDCFLLPNDELGRRGLGMQKGFPASYDTGEIERFLDGLDTDGTAEVPVYSHAVYDRVKGEYETIGPADVIVIEGVNALQPPLAGRLDVAVYLDAGEADIERWFVARFLDLCLAAETDDSSFYRGFVGLSPGEQARMASSVWSAINLVNLREHIAPTKAAAHVVVAKAGDHSLRD
ncbi:MAG: type pantothenate kinase [Actinomycetota bacterium]|jgi:type I pantothenate kinase|nr:type pantothenate kinase [Actinomycetota bacterium]